MTDLDQLAAFDRAATPGPWHVGFLDDDHCMNAIGIASEPDTDEHEDLATFNNSGPELLATCLIQSPPYLVSRDGRWQENAKLIVAVRNTSPELLRLARVGAAADGKG